MISRICRFCILNLQLLNSSVMLSYFFISFSLARFSFVSVRIQLIQYCTFFQPLTSGPFFSIHISNINQSLTTIIKEIVLQIAIPFFIYKFLSIKNDVYRKFRNHNYFTFLSKLFWIPNNF